MPLARPPLPSRLTKEHFERDLHVSVPSALGSLLRQAEFVAKRKPSAEDQQEFEALVMDRVQEVARAMPTFDWSLMNLDTLTRPNVVQECTNLVSAQQRSAARSMGPKKQQQQPKQQPRKNVMPLEWFKRAEFTKNVSDETITKMALADKPNRPGKYDSRDSFITCAAAHGRKDLVVRLLAAGVHVDRSRFWHEEVLKMGGYTKEWDWHSFTPLAAAIIFGHVELAEFLVANGASTTISMCPVADEYFTPTELITVYQGHDPRTVTKLTAALKVPVIPQLPKVKAKPLPTLYCDMCAELVPEDEFDEKQLAKPHRRCDRRDSSDEAPKRKAESDDDDDDDSDEWKTDDDEEDDEEYHDDEYVDDGHERLCRDCEKGSKERDEMVATNTKVIYHALVKEERAQEKRAGRYTCSECQEQRPMNSYANKSDCTTKTSEERVCKICSSPPKAATAHHVDPMGGPVENTSQVKEGGIFVCAACSRSLTKASYSKNQLSHKEARKCKDCVAGAPLVAGGTAQPTKSAPPPPAVPVAAGPKKRGDYKITEGVCPLCGSRYPRSMHEDGLFGRPDGDVECKSYAWLTGNCLEFDSRCFYVCGRHSAGDMPLPWGKGLYGSNSKKKTSQKPKPKETMMQQATLIATIQMMESTSGLPPGSLMAQMQGGGGYYDDDDDDDDYGYPGRFGGSPGRFGGGGGGGYGQFSASDVEELAMQGVSPWDPDAAAVMAVLNGEYY